MDKPLISVLMPVYNGEKYLKIAIESILSQSYQHFEFLVIDDGSKDESRKIIEAYSDPRIILSINNGNMGLISTLNKGLGLAKGKYIARMDQDDISLPKRLETQVLYMEKHPDIGVCGCRIKVFGTGKEFSGDCPLNPDETKCWLFFNTPVAHPSVIIRASVLKEHHLRYNPEYPWAEDFAFWIDAEKYTRITNIPQALLKYRLHNTNMSLTSNHTQKDTVNKIRMGKLNELGVTDPVKINFHLSWGNQEFQFTSDFAARLEAWLKEIIELNRNKKIYPEPLFTRNLAKLYFDTCYQSVKSGMTAWKCFYRSFFRHKIKISLLKQIKFTVKSILKG